MIEASQDFDKIESNFEIGVEIKLGKILEWNPVDFPTHRVVESNVMLQKIIEIRTSFVSVMYVYYLYKFLI